MNPRYYFHGDAAEHDPSLFFCSACDLFQPRDHFTGACGSRWRFDRALECWPVRAARFRRPADAVNLFAEGVAA
jgi:hypothetical protein